MISIIFNWILVIAGVVVVGGLAWVISAFPRARKWTARCAEDMNAPFSSWTPPTDEPARNDPFPSFDTVDWTKLSPHVDDEGIHFIDYDAVGQRGVAGKRRIPANIAHFAIKHAKKYVETGNRDDLLLCARQFEYIAATAAEVNIEGRTAVLWRADFDLGYQYKVTAPWSSAYFQIYCMNALLWAHWLFGDARFLDIAEKGFVPLARPLEEDGLGSRTTSGGLFFEEVVSSPPHHILNGHFHTLINIYYFWKYTGLSEAGRLFEMGVTAAADMLPKFDWRGYSLYSLAPNPGLKNHFNIANPFYHRAHIRMLRKLHELTDNAMFAEQADRWLRSCNGTFDTLWSILLIIFRDFRKTVK